MVVRHKLALAVLALLALVLVGGTAVPMLVASAAEAACSTSDAVWVGTFGGGANCIDDAGFHSYVKDPKDTKGVTLSSNLTKDVAICADKKTYVATALGISVFDGKAWALLKPSNTTSGYEAVACAKDGIWVAHFRGISFYDGKAWTTYDSKELGTDSTSTLVKDVAVAPDGRVWTVTSKSAAVFADKKWTMYEKGKGLEKDFFMSGVALDSKGTPWVTHSSGLLTFDGKAWKTVDNKDMTQPQTVMVDSQDRVWIGTFAKGIFVYDGKAWTVYNREKSKITANQIRRIAQDGTGRMWIGTEYGLNVFDGKEWRAYHMHTSDLLDNPVYNVAAVGKGPAKLPEFTEKKGGSVTGKLMNGQKPLAGSQVELCTLFIGSLFSGKTPCADNPFTMSGTTDDEGVFVIDDVPVGRYGFVVQNVEKKWIRFIGTDNKIVVAEGKPTDIGSIDTSKTR